MMEDEHHYDVAEFKDSENVNTDYVHKVCWDKFLGDINNASDSLTQSKSLLKSMSDHMKKVGIIPSEEVVYV